MLSTAEQTGLPSAKASREAAEATNAGRGFQVTSRFEPSLEREFWASYSAVGIRYLEFAAAVAAVILLVWWFVDVLRGLPLLFGSGQGPRVALGVVCLAIAFLLRRYRDWTKRRSVVIVNVTFLLVLQGVAYVVYGVRKDLSVYELLWALTASMSVGILVLFGFARLSFLNTMAIALVTCAATLFYAGLHPGLTGFAFARLVVYLTWAVFAAAALRWVMERRERELFLTAKENLRLNVYADELRAASAAAAEASEVKSRFLSNMSHEVRTPLSGIVQVLELIQDDVRPSSKPLVAKATQAGYALVKTLNDILDYSKLQRGPEAIELSEVDLEDLAATVTSLHEATAASKGLRLTSEVDLPREVVQVRADRVKLLEVANNLVSNALKFTTNGSVHLALKCTPSTSEGEGGAYCLLIEVRDSGPGISSEDQSRIFLPFVQLKSTTRSSLRGTGLGLSIVSALVNLMGGTVKLRSAVGEGSTFCVQVPVQVVLRPNE